MTAAELAIFAALIAAPATFAGIVAVKAAENIVCWLCDRRA